MEERIMDDEESRKIKIKRTKSGETDAVEEDAEEELEEVLLDLPEGDEYDEDLVGLTPSQLQEELKRREKAAAEARATCKKLVEEGERLLKIGKFSEAETFFAQALLYDDESPDIQRGLWASRTQGMRDIDGLLTEEHAEEFARADGAIRKEVLSALGEKLKAERETCMKEEKELTPRVEGEQAKRREAFTANRRYYKLRLCVFLALAVAFAIGAAISAGFIYRTQTVYPVVFTAVFAGLAVIAVCVAIFFSRGLIVASRLCRENERLSSTEEGARLAYLRDRLECLETVLETK